MKKTLRRLLAAICTAGLLLAPASALTVEEAIELLEWAYVDPLPEAAYEAATLDELFQAIGDPYTYYMSKEEYQAFTDAVEGASQVGIGVAIQYKDEGILISRIIPGGAAEEAGLAAGDTIIAIDGVSCVPGQESDVNRITGAEGTQVTIEVLRADGSTQSFTLKRRPFTVPTATVSLLENGQGYIQCDSFGSTTGGIFTDGIEKYDGQTSLWLVDVRSNAGGRLDAAQDTVGVFTGPAYVVWLRDASGQYSCGLALNEALTSDPAVVLTNLYSASASEILSSALKDYGAGIVLGGRTYGKGVAQIVLDEDNVPGLFDGDALKITAYRFYSPAMNTTDCVGTLPTLLVPDDQTAGVAQLLRTEEPQSKTGWLRLTLSGLNFYIDVASAQKEEAGPAALAALFAALPPRAETAVGENGSWTSLAADEAAQKLGVVYTSRWFTDVAGSPYADELNIMATYDLLRGEGNGAYAPDNSITRAELCAMLCHALNRTSAGTPTYSDVPADAWYAPYVAKITEMGLMDGKGGGVFDPDGQVTNQELVTVLGRLACFLNANCHELIANTGDIVFNGDALAGYDGWAKPYVWMLADGYRDNVDETVPDMLLRAPEDTDPLAATTRGEAGAVLCRVLMGLGILKY